MVKLLQNLEGFEWDNANREKNLIAHGVSWEETEQVFFNTPLYIVPDKKHSVVEVRYYLLGKTDAHRLLFSAFTVRNNKVRIISARDMHKKERTVYNEKAQNDSQI